MALTSVLPDRTQAPSARAAPLTDERPPRARRTPAPATVVTLLTIIALGIRLVIVRGFWLDEATSGYDSRLSFGGMLHQLLHDNHPPLEYTVLWVTAHTIGSTQTDLRLPSIVFGTLTIPMLYLAGRALYNEWAGVLAAAFGSVGALAVWYAQEARMYALFILLATVTIWAQASILRSPLRRYWVAWALAGAAMIWTQWFASLAVGTEILIFGWIFFRSEHRRRNIRRLSVAALAVAVATAPGLPLLLTQYHNNQANGLGFGSHTSGVAAGGFSPYGIFNNLVWALFGYHSNPVVGALVAIWPIGILATFLILGRGRNRSHRMMATLIAVPMLITFVASGETAANRSLFEVRYFIEAVPALYLVLAGAICTMAPTARVRWTLVVVTLAAFGAGLVTQQTDSANPRLYGYSAAFSQISSIARPGDEIVYAPGYLNVDVAYFEPHMRAVPVSGQLPRLPLSNQIFVVGSFDFAGAQQSDAAAAQVVGTLKRSRHLDEVLHAPNVTVWEFS